MKSKDHIAKQSYASEALNGNEVASRINETGKPDRKSNEEPHETHVEALRIPAETFYITQVE